MLTIISCKMTNVSLISTITIISIIKQSANWAFSQKSKADFQTLDHLDSLKV